MFSEFAARRISCKVQTQLYIPDLQRQIQVPGGFPYPTMYFGKKQPEIDRIAHIWTVPLFVKHGFSPQSFWAKNRHIFSC